MAKIANWGNYPVIEADVRESADAAAAGDIIRSAGSLIARGMGRCYGDSALAPVIFSTLKLNRILAFDRETGVVTCQSGVTFAQLLDILLPQGWFPPVTPGTKFITVGGAIASDVHGKNHHAEGSFSAHLLSFELMDAGGSIHICTPSENAELFRMTCGGMGLTGIILSATFRMKPVQSAWIRQDTIKARSLEEIMRLFRESAGSTYTVAWIDCLSAGRQLGRSIMLRGEHAKAGEAEQTGKPLEIPRRAKLTVPFRLPSFTLNRYTVQAFNTLYYARHPAGTHSAVVDYDAFFYPLDRVHHWNRIYGLKGFTQYQLVLPVAESEKGIVRILAKLRSSGRGPFLSVLKLFGRQDNDNIAFPMEGYTLTLDFPVTRGLFPFLDKLDRIVADHGGRLYLSKDVRMSKAFFMSTYEHAPAFIETVRSVNPQFTFRSLQSERTGLTP